MYLSVTELQARLKKTGRREGKELTSGWGGLLLESKCPHICMLGPLWLCLGAMVAELSTSVKHAAVDLHT